jgi:hypothetical protein
MMAKCIHKLPAYRQGPEQGAHRNCASVLKPPVLINISEDIPSDLPLGGAGNGYVVSDKKDLAVFLVSVFQRGFACG